MILFIWICKTFLVYKKAVNVFSANYNENKKKQYFEMS